MSRAIEILRELAARAVLDEDGNERRVLLADPLSAIELATLEARIPCPLPPDARELLSFTRGFDTSPLESVDFSGLTDPIFDEILPCGIPVAHDGFGNYWVVDLTARSQVWGPILFVCHDPPVVVHQCADIAQFIQGIATLAVPPHGGPLDEVHEQHSMRIWQENPGVVVRDEALKSADDAVRAFAEHLTPEHFIIDLRHAATGDGFSWGRFGPKTPITRAGDEPIFAYAGVSKKSRFWGFLTGR